VALVPLSNTKSTIFTYIVGTDIQEVLYGAERERERERFVFVFFFFHFKCVGFYSTVLDQLNT